MAHTSEYEIEDIFIDRLEGIGYKFIKLNNYDEVLANFREQLAKFNAKKLEEKGHTASFSDSEFKAYMSEIIENGYNLNIPRYVDTFEEEEPVDLDAVRNRIKTLDSETKAAIDKAESFMRELGL